MQVVVVSSSQERVNAAVKAIGSAAKGEVVDATKEDQVGRQLVQVSMQLLRCSAIVLSRMVVEASRETW